MCCKMGYSTDVLVSNYDQERGIAPMWGEVPASLKGYRAILGIAISRDMVREYQMPLCKSKKPWASIFTLLPCGIRCRFSESAIFFLEVCPPSNEGSSNKIKHLGGVWLGWRLTLSDMGPLSWRAILERVSSGDFSQERKLQSTWPNFQCYTRVLRLQDPLWGKDRLT